MRSLNKFFDLQYSEYFTEIIDWTLSYDIFIADFKLWFSINMLVWLVKKFQVLLLRVGLLEKCNFEIYDHCTF